jgi:DNA-binding SARP family transcriptional activator/tRNA A-37 threonylcarbamoyl transferase component Bud32
VIDFRVLGPLELKGPDGEDLLSVLSQPKRVALLAYLALATGQGFRRRDTIIGIFWPDLDQDRARGALRKSLYFLRRSVGEEALKGRGDEEVALNRAEVACDVVDFEDALKEDERERALELYRGDLLEGLFISGSPEFERWLDGERERLREMAARAAWALAHRYLSSGRVTDGERMGQRALALVPTDENEVQRFIKGLTDAGDRAAAVRFYEKFARELKELLDLRPAAETRTLVKRIRDTLGTPVPPPAPSRPSPPAAPTPPSPVATPASPSGSPPKTELFHRVKGALSHRYGIEREIGRGAMATVFLAEDPKHRRKVALKVLDPELAEALGADRFLREIEIAANLTHPHILPLFDSGEANGLLYYVMPFVEGESLRSRLEREKQLPVADAAAITREVASALAFAHEKGVIHRDVKPANILLEAGHAVLADFGIAHAVALAGETRQTRSGVSLGTPAYMSPEQSTGETDLDGRSDQYALGCVLYEMLAGDQPFRGPTGESVARQHLTRDPHAITDLRPSVPEEIASALHRAMEKAPSDRFSGMRGFADALRAETAPSTKPLRAGSGSREKKTLLRSPRFWGLSAAGLAVVVASTLLMPDLLRGPEGPPIPPPGGEVVLAVMPFADLAPEQAGELSERMATWLAMALDPVEGIRTVDRNILFPFIGPLGPGQRLSLADAREAAEDLQATHFILGEAISGSAGSLTVTATPYLVGDGSGEAPEVLSVAGGSGNLVALAEDLAEKLLPFLDIPAVERLSGIAAVTSDSVSARDAYLRGEEGFRATRYAEAYDSFHEAVEVDPTFALAHYRKSLVAVMILRFDEAERSAVAAMEHRYRLDTRERRLVEAWAALVRGSAQEAQRLYRSILDKYPDEVEALFGLGTAQVYFNPILGNSTAEAEAQFRRVLELSPNFGQARFHLLEFATRRRDQPAFDSLKAGVDPGSDQALAWDAVRAFWLGGREDQQRIENRMLRVGPVEAGLAVGRVAAFLQDHQAAEELATLLTGPGQDEETRTAAPFLVAMTRFAQGRWTDGMASLDLAGEFSPAWAIEMKALLTGFPPRTPSSEELVAVLETLRDWDADVGSTDNFVLFAHNGYHSYLRTYLLALTSTWAGDSEAAQAYAAELRDMPRSSGRGAVIRSWAEAIVARIFASRGETAEAVRRLRVAPPDVPLWLTSISPFFSRSLDRYALGELLRDNGQSQDALRWFRTLTEGHELVLVAPTYLQMARIEEDLGNTTDALEHYRRFVELWENADAEFLPLLNEARAKIAQLTGSS